VVVERGKEKRRPHELLADPAGLPLLPSFAVPVSFLPDLRRLRQVVLHAMHAFIEF